MGLVTAGGHNTEDTWDSVVNGRSAVRKISRFDASGYDSQIASEIGGAISLEDGAHGDGARFRLEFPGAPGEKT